MDKHRLAFVDHGAEFFVGSGADPARALVLVAGSLTHRETGGAHTDAVEAHQGAKPPEACRSTAAATATGSPDRELGALLDGTLPTARRSR